MSNNPDFQNRNSIKIAFPLRVDGAVFSRRQVGQQFTGFRVPAKEDFGIGCGVKGREYDIYGGHAAGIQTVGVLYGYGSREELESAGADALAETPEALLARLL